MLESAVIEVTDAPVSDAPVSDAPVEGAGPVVVALDNLGPIVHCEIPIIPGAVTVLCGSNGVGKTTAQKAVTGVLAKSGRELSPRDGVEAGSVEMPGVRVRIGKKMTVKGDPGETFCMIEDGEELSQFINPGIAKAASADAKRIEALLKMSQVVIQESVFSEFVGPEDWREFNAALDSSKEGPVERVAKLKRWLDSKARTAEIEVEQTTGAIVQIGDIPPAPEIFDPVELSAKQSELIGRIATAKQAIRSSLAARESLQALSVVSGSVPEIDEKLETARQEKTEATEVLQPLQSECDQKVNQFRESCDAELERIRKHYEDQIAGTKRAYNERISSLRASIASADSKIRTLDDERAKLVSFTETSQRLLKESETPWTVETVQNLQEEADHVAKQIREAAVAQEVARTRDRKIETLKYQERKKAGAEARVKRFRDLAHRTPVILSDAVKNLSGWSIMNHGGEIRLMCEHRRGMICFDQLSPGEAVARALDVRCQPRDYRGRIAVASVDAELWAALDGDAKQHVLDHIAETGISILTSRCSDTHEPKGLHAVVMKAEAAGAPAAADQSEPEVSELLSEPIRSA